MWKCKWKSTWKFRKPMIILPPTKGNCATIQTHFGKWTFFNLGVGNKSFYPFSWIIICQCANLKSMWISEKCSISVRIWPIELRYVSCILKRSPSLFYLKIRLKIAITALNCSEELLTKYFSFCLSLTPRSSSLSFGYQTVITMISRTTLMASIRIARTTENMINN